MYSKYTCIYIYTFTYVIEYVDIIVPMYYVIDLHIDLHPMDPNTSHSELRS